MRRKINQFKKKHRMTQMIAVLMFLFTFSIINVMKTMQEKKCREKKEHIKDRHKRYENKRAVSNFCRQNTPHKINSKIRTDY